MAAPMATRKAKKVSKNKKKNWRKHVNIDDVEEYLEDKRLQERTGGLVAEKSDDALFFIEKTAESEISEKSNISKIAGKRKRTAKDTSLKCFANLQSDSSIKIPKTPRSDLPRSLKKLDKRTDKKVQRMVISQKKKELAQVRRSAAATKSTEPQFYDLWGNNADETIFKKKFTLEGRNISKDDDAYFLRQTNRVDIQIPKRTIGKKPSAVPNVEVPHAGASYNPSYDDHQELLQKAWEIEVQKEKKEMKITRALDDFFPTAANAPTEASYLKEMSAGIFTPIDDGESDDETVISGGVSYNPPVRREDKKTITQRNKEKRIKEKQDKVLKAKQDRVKKKEMFQLKELKKEVNRQQKRTEEKISRKAEREKQKAYEAKNLGKLKFEAPDIELKLGEELEGSLRLLKPEGNLLVDRFKSLQKRNLIEPRERAKNKRKYKPKEFEKKTHREVTL